VVGDAIADSDAEALVVPGSTGARAQSGQFTQ
jgi:hypothetical protein